MKLKKKKKVKGDSFWRIEDWIKFSKDVYVYKFKVVNERYLESEIDVILDRRKLRLSCYINFFKFFFKFF